MYSSSSYRKNRQTVVVVAVIPHLPIILPFLFFCAATKSRLRQQQITDNKATVNRKSLIKGNRENQYISADTHTHRHTHTGGTQSLAHKGFPLGVAGKTFI